MEILAFLVPVLASLIAVAWFLDVHIWFGNQLQARRNHKLELKREERRLIEAQNERDRLAIEAAQAELVDFDRRHPQLPSTPPSTTPQDDLPS